MSVPKRATGKDRSQRIQIGYYKIRTGLDRWRTASALIGLLVAGGYACYVLALTSRSGAGNHISTGPVAAVHASFEQDCQKCHVDFTPMDPHAPSQWLPLIGGDAEASRVHIEEACQQCHAVGPHHRTRMHASFAIVDQNCAHCHHDHSGRDHDLADIDQQLCVDCHNDLVQVVNDEPRARANVNAFNEAGHGDFESLLGEDSGRILFSHHQHMLPGQVSPDDNGGMTLAQLSPADRERYRQAGQTDSQPLQLQCSSCHTMEGQDLISSDDEARAIDVTRLGSTMKPIQFDRHCAACHAISAGSASGEALPLPHAVPWSQMNPLLAASINGDRALGVASHPQDTARVKPQLGIGADQIPQGDWRVTEAELAAARSRVESQCLDCHEYDAIEDEAIAAAQLGNTEPMIPRRWLKSGFYDHAVHREIACQHCHADAFPELAESGDLNLDFDDADRVMIGGIETCEGCHRPAESPLPTEFATANEKWWGGMSNWASDQCTMCHRYHAQPMLTPSNASSSVKPGELAQPVREPMDLAPEENSLASLLGEERP